MESTIAFGILNKAITFLVIIPTLHSPNSTLNTKVIIINKVIPRIIRRVYINHFYLAEVCLLQKLQYLKVVALDIEVFSIVKINAFFSARAERFVYRCIGKKNRFFLVGPSKLIAFFVTVNDLAGNLLHKYILINSTDYLAVFVNRLCYGIGEHSCQLLEILISLICRLHFQFIHYACPP